MSQVRRVAPGISGAELNPEKAEAERANQVRRSSAGVASRRVSSTPKRRRNGHKECRQCGRPWITKPSGRPHGYLKICTGCDQTTDSCTCAPITPSIAPAQPRAGVSSERVLWRLEELIDRIEEGPIGALLAPKRK